MTPTLLDPDSPIFPDINLAAIEPDGLLAIGGNLQPNTLLSAYYQGIFPWFNQQDPILWWSPSERCVIRPRALHVSKSLRRCLSKENYIISMDTAFLDVVNACAARGEGIETWITPEMIEAYHELYLLGHGHSLEVWKDNNLIGGIYGLAIGGVFCGESMFSHAANGSKIALFYLCQHLIERGIELLDCQLVNRHLLSMGAESMQRDVFLSILADNRDRKIQWD
jgi:leucyl/phenylalanyl-tRNA--protein transferase